MRRFKRFQKCLQTLLLITAAAFVAPVFANGNPTTAPQQPGQAVRSPSSLNLNSKELGFNGPLSIGTQISSAFGPIVTMKYAQLLDPNDAMMLEGDIGPMEYRIAGTWGRKLTEKQRAKLTIERLAQKIDFGFTAGSTERWVGQNAVGGDYQVLLNNNWLNSLDVSGYYASAASKHLPDVTVGSTTWQRHIAGATSTGAKLGVSASPWTNGVVSAAINYDNVNYHRKYARMAGSAKSEGGIGQTVTLSQLLTQRTKFELSQSYRKVYNQYSAGFSWLVPSKPGQRIELGVNASRTTSNAATEDDNRVGLKASFAWGGNRLSKAAVYSAANDSLIGSLLAWTGQPAVHMAEVLAVADEQIKAPPQQKQTQEDAQPVTAAQQFNVIAGQVFNVPAGYVIDNTNLATLNKQNLKPTAHTVSIPATDTIGKTYTLSLKPEAAAGQPLLAANNGVAIPVGVLTPKNINLQVVSSAAASGSWAPSINTPVYDTIKTVNLIENQQNVVINFPNKQPYFHNTTNLFNNPSTSSEMTYSLSATSVLPPGITAVKNAAGTSVDALQGSPTQKGTWHYTITAKNYFGTAQADFTIVVGDDNPAYNGTTIPTQTGQEGKPISQIATAQMFSGASLQYSMTVDNAQNQAANINLTINPTNGIITGTPPAPSGNNPTGGSAGNYTITVKVTNQFGTATATPFNLTVEPAAPVNVSAITAPDGAIGAPYTLQTQQAFIGSLLKYRSTTLPNGLVINQATGEISGTPTKEETTQVTVTAYNYNGTTEQSAQTSFSLKINAAGPPVTKGTIPNQTLTIGGPTFNYNAAANFSGANIKYSIAANPALAGLVINPTSGEISFTPNSGVGTYNVTVTADNGVAPNAIQKFTLTVNPLDATLLCPANPTNPTSQGTNGKTYNFTKSSGNLYSNSLFGQATLSGQTLTCYYYQNGTLTEGTLTNTTPLVGQLSLPLKPGPNKCVSPSLNVNECPLTMKITSTN